MQEENSVVGEALHKVQDVAGGLMGRAGAALTTDARSFVEQAAISDLYEIGSSYVALDRASSERVRLAARMMIEDHRTTTQRLRGIVGRDPELQPPTVLDSRRQGMMDHLIRAGGDFEAVYVDQQVLAHQEALTLMHSYGSSGEHEGLRAYGAETAPIIERHLEHMREVRGSLDP